jgi:hypothetical protein
VGFTSKCDESKAKHVVQLEGVRKFLDHPQAPPCSRINTSNLPHICVPLTVFTRVLPVGCRHSVGGEFCILVVASGACSGPQAQAPHSLLPQAVSQIPTFPPFARDPGHWQGVMPLWAYVDNLGQTPVIVWLALLLVSVLYLRDR